jgi:hypothetical protein
MLIVVGMHKSNKDHECKRKISDWGLVKHFLDKGCPTLHHALKDSIFMVYAKVRKKYIQCECSLSSGGSKN